MSAPVEPWVDVPTCPKCKVAHLSTTVPADEDVPSNYDPDGDDDSDEGMYPSDELDALNDCDVPTWLWCGHCESVIEAGAAAFAQRAKADAWWERPDRDEAWADVLRQRKVDAIAAEHARRQLPLFGGGS